MRTLTMIPRRFCHRAKSSAIGCTMATGLVMGTLGSAQAECSWIVQPHFDDRRPLSETTLVNIVFDGLVDQQQFLYGFTVTNIDLAWDLSTDGTLTDLGPHGRALDVMETAVGPAFEVSAESIQPHTVYLVAASSPVGGLEDIGATIEPSQPFNISLAKTRGGTDISGPLPTRSLSGVEIRASKSGDEVRQWLTLLDRGLEADGEHGDGKLAAETTMAANDAGSALAVQDKDGVRHDVQICAYQVAMR